ncbi:hypothetical protein COO60DRAFT_847050 [Scenedesmus sp. NREL 46B-D3]|nr:hypothetical protein COO60DRAFT_847050 [Scenedesmus sp. NREL 46B-D3]
MAREKAAANLQEAYKKRQELAEKAYQQRLAASGSASQTLTKTNRHQTGPQGSSSGNSSPHKPQSARSMSAKRSHPQEQQECGELRRGGSAGTSPVRRANSAGTSPRPGSSTRHMRTSQGLNVPDFRTLHANWQAQQAAIKAANRKRVTVPEEFAINGGTPEEQAARAQKAVQRRERIVASMQEDAQQLREMRWPYVSSRAPVQPTPPPHHQHEGGAARPHSTGPQVGPTLAAQLRAAVTKQAMASGKFDTREERERKQWEQMKAEQHHRQQQWQAVQAGELRSAWSSTSSSCSSSGSSTLSRACPARPHLAVAALWSSRVLLWREPPRQQGCFPEVIQPAEAWMRQQRRQQGVTLLRWCRISKVPRWHLRLRWRRIWTSC